jgi:hypothetical protein
MTWRYLRAYLANNKMTYAQYLNSEHWQDVRARFWAGRLHNGTCSCCGGRNKLQVHHRTYRRIGREWLNDLRLCLSGRSWRRNVTTDTRQQRSLGMP